MKTKINVKKTKVEKLSKNPRLFRSLTGLTVDKFNELFVKLKPIYERVELKRKTNGKRIRKIGGGNAYKLALEDRLLMLLIYYRTYLTIEFLEFMFGLHNSNVSRRINQLTPLLTKIFKIPERKIKLSNEEVGEIYEAFFDGTEQPINRPGNRKGRKDFYSGKKKTHTIKHQVTTSNTGKIKAVSKNYIGKTHDKTIYDNSRTYTIVKVRKKSVRFKGHGDLAYLGTNLYIPFKKPKGKELTVSQKKYNHRFNSRRTKLCEHPIGKMKIFRIIHDKFRNPLKKHTLIFKNIAGLTNMMFYPA